MKLHACVYISTPDPKFEHQNIIYCSYLRTHVTKEFCSQCDKYVSLSEALDKIISSKKEANYDN